MSSIVISGDTSGAITLAAPSVAGTNTITLPAGTGTAAVQGVSTNIVSGTAVASTSGTSVSITGIPSWVKRITLTIFAVGTNGSSGIESQIGSGSLKTSGYGGAQAYISGNTVASSTIQTGLGVVNLSSASYLWTGTAIWTNIGSNIWIGTSSTAITSNSSGTELNYATSTVTLSGTLDRVALATTNGTDVFTNGSINILYE